MTVTEVDALASSYAALELAPGAGLPAVRRAYRELARRTHPDAAGTSASACFAEVARAYAVLRDEQSRGNAWRRARALEAYAPRVSRAARAIDVVVA